MKNLNSLSLILGVFTAIASSCTGPLADVKDEKEKSNDNKQELIKRGKYLVTIGACHDCHSPKVMTPEGWDVDTTRLLSGHPEKDIVPQASADHRLGTVQQRSYFVRWSMGCILFGQSHP